MRVVLDDLPAMAAPLAATNLPQVPAQGAKR
jgi:hypothetical protein